MSSKVTAILEATNGEVGVLEGWGGMYGVMPGLAVSDLLARVFHFAKKDSRSARPARTCIFSLLPWLAHLFGTR